MQLQSLSKVTKLNTMLVQVDAKHPHTLLLVPRVGTKQVSAWLLVTATTAACQANPCIACSLPCSITS